MCTCRKRGRWNFYPKLVIRKGIEFKNPLPCVRKKTSPGIVWKKKNIRHRSENSEWGRYCSRVEKNTTFSIPFSPHPANLPKAGRRTCRRGKRTIVTVHKREKIWGWEWLLKPLPKQFFFLPLPLDSIRCAVLLLYGSKGLWCVAATTIPKLYLERTLPLKFLCFLAPSANIVFAVITFPLFSWKTSSFSENGGARQRWGKERFRKHPDGIPVDTHKPDSLRLDACWHSLCFPT